MRGLALMAFPVALMAADRLVEGRQDSPVRVVIFEDLQCGDCARFRRMMDQVLLPRFGARVAFEHRDFPLAKHSWARQAALAARHFERVKPELGVAFRRYILELLKTVTPGNLPGIVSAFARKHGADPESAVRALEDAALAALVDKDIEDGVARGVTRTPTVFVNGTPLIESFTVEEISQAIEGELMR